MRELKDEIHSLVDELNALSARNDELMAEREQDAEGMDEMESKVQEYKRKYDAVRIELRNLKGELRCVELALICQRRQRCLSRSHYRTITCPLRPMETSRMSMCRPSRLPLTVC